MEIIFLFVHGEINTIDKEESFITDDDLQAEVYINMGDDRVSMQVIYGDGFYGAYVNISETCYKQYKDEILDVLKSMKIMESSES